MEIVVLDVLASEFLHNRADVSHALVCEVRQSASSDDPSGHPLSRCHHGLDWQHDPRVVREAAVGSKDSEAVDPSHSVAAVDQHGILSLTF